MPEAPKTAWKLGDPLLPWNGENDVMRDWMFHQLENFYRTHRIDVFKTISSETENIFVRVKL